jgi:hypothetical protein
MTVEDFQTRWLNVHGPLVRRMRKDLPQMKRYVQSHTLMGEATEMVRTSRGAKEPYDGITEVWFEDMESVAGEGEAAMNAATKLFEDEAEFIDFSNSSVFFTEEHVIF